MLKRMNWIALAMAGCVLLALGMGVSVAIAGDDAAASMQEEEAPAATDKPGAQRR